VERLARSHFEKPSLLATAPKVSAAKPPVCAATKYPSGRYRETTSAQLPGLTDTLLSSETLDGCGSGIQQV